MYFFRFRALSWPAALAAIFLAAGIGAGQATALTVTSLDDSGPGTLRSAIELAAGGDTIVFQAGLSGTITLATPLPILAGNLTIQGPGADAITVSGGGQHRVFFIELDAVVAISGLTIADGFTVFPIDGSGAETDGLGGGIFNAGDLTLEDSVVRDSIAEFGGGGISNEGSLRLVRTAITGNDVDSGGLGGGLENFEGAVTVIDSTMSGNAADIGGAIENFGDVSGVAALTLLNSTISGNSATDDGGGIDNFGGDVTLSFSTIAGNAAAFGGGVLNAGTFTARNTTIADSPTGSNCADAGTSFSVSGNNLATDSSCPGFVQTTSAALALGLLADNGGPTRTHALGEDGAAVDAAPDCTDIDGTTVSSDQRGVDRPQGSACDIGAFERLGTEEIIFVDSFEGE